MRGVTTTFITEKPPPKGRAGKCVGQFERHLHEAAVMLAIALWMFELGAEKVCLHPDGMHAKQFDICGWLKNKGFERIAKKGKTREAGTYVRSQQTLDVQFAPGRGDVTADLNGCHVVVEAKGALSTRAIRDKNRSYESTSTRRSACCLTARKARIA